MQMEETFDKEWLFYIGASIKQEKILNSRFAGQFGEGFKVASLVAYRDFQYKRDMWSFINKYSTLSNNRLAKKIWRESEYWHGKMK